MELSVEGGIRRPGFRNVYWPGGAAGVLHFRFKGGTLVSPVNHTAPQTLEVGYVTNSMRKLIYYHRPGANTSIILR